MSEEVDYRKCDAQAEAMGCRVKPNTIWGHHRGGLYEVLAVAVDEAQLSLHVVYRSIEKGYVWIRPLHVFLEVLPGGKQRFVRMP